MTYSPQVITILFQLILIKFCQASYFVTRKRIFLLLKCFSIGFFLFSRCFLCQVAYAGEWDGDSKQPTFPDENSVAKLTSLLNENRDYLEKVLNDNKFANTLQKLRQTTENCRQKIENAAGSSESESDVEAMNKELIRLTNGCTFEMAVSLVGEMIIEKNVDVNSHQLQLHNYSRGSFDRRVRICRQKFSGKSQAMQEFKRLFKLKLSKIDEILSKCESSMEKTLKEVSQLNDLVQLVLSKVQDPHNKYDRKNAQQPHLAINTIFNFQNTKTLVLKGG